MARERGSFQLRPGCATISRVVFPGVEVPVVGMFGMGFSYHSS